MHKASTCSPIWERSSESQWLKNLPTCARSGSVTASLAQSSCTIVTAGLVNSPPGLVPGCPCHTNMHFLLDKCWRILLAQLLNFYGPLLGDMNWSIVTKNLFKKDEWHYCLSHSIFIVAQSQTSVLCINNNSPGFNPFPGPKLTCLEPPLALPLWVAAWLLPQPHFPQQDSWISFKFLDWPPSPNAHLLLFTC